MNDEKKPVEENEELCENEAENEVSTEEISEKKEKNAAFANLMGKTAVFGKKVAGGIQKGAGAVSEQIKKSAEEHHEQKLKDDYERKMKRYNPLFKEEFKSKKFKIPNVIKIVDDASRNGIDVCEGAIGWRETVKGVEFLFLYDEFVKESKLQFFPFAKCDTVYCVDPFDRNAFINADTIFERVTNEKLAELEHVAYCLGAKSCSIEIVETDSEATSTAAKLTGKMKSIGASVGAKSSEANRKINGGKNVSYFEGNTEAKHPTLKWFALDENIKGLIEMRCGGNNSIKSKVLELKAATTATMSKEIACAIDGVLGLKASMSLEKKSVKEHSKLLVFEVDF